MSDLLTESLFEGEAAVAAFESESGGWDITLHFAQAPDEAAIRAFDAQRFADGGVTDGNAVRCSDAGLLQF